MNEGVDTPERDRNRFIALAALIVVVATALRLLYVFTTRVESPLYGDSLQYMAYAWNLLNHGVFSFSPPHSAVAVPDSYRGPGYPLFVAMALWFGGEDPQSGIQLALVFQALISGATVLLSIAIARLWMSRGFALTVGVFVALWPHLISFSGTLMSETLFGFFVALGLWLVCMAQRDGRLRIAIAAAGAFGCAYFVNPTILFFPFLVGALLLRVGKPRLAAVFVAVSLLAPAVWMIRNANLDLRSSDFRRAAENIVQGSSPLYLQAFNSRWVSPEAKAIVDYANEETKRIAADPRAGFAAVFERIGADPGTYLAWYLLEKPYTLWDWSIIVGTGDIYYPVTLDSPFKRIAVLGFIKDVARWSNPLLFALAAIAAFRFGFWRVRRSGAKGEFVPVLLALFLLYVTAIHVVFQAEPRYSIPYRPEEIVLAFVFIFGVRRWYAGRFVAHTDPSGTMLAASAATKGAAER